MSEEILNRREKKKVDTMNRIVSTAVELFRKNGVENTTMEEISETVDIAKGTLYNHFSSKEEIIDSYIKKSFKTNYSERMKKLNEIKGTEAKINFIYKLLLSGIGNNDDLFEHYLVYRMKKMVSFEQKAEEKSGFYLLGEVIIDQGQKSGEIRTDIPARTIREFFEFIFIQIVKDFFASRDKNEIDKKISRYVDMFMNGVRKNAES